MFRIVFLLVLLFSVLGCQQETRKPLSLPYYNDPDFTPLFIDPKNSEINVNHKVADFSFLNQDSLTVTQKNIEGKIHIANFVFTSCGSICPSMIHNAQKLMTKLNGDTSILFLSYSVTPWIDKPHVLRRYIENNGINTSQWHFLTGEKAKIYSLARQSYFAEESIGFSKDSSEFLHTEHFILVDREKRIRGIYNGTLPLEVENLFDDIQTLKLEDE